MDDFNAVFMSASMLHSSVNRTDLNKLIRANDTIATSLNIVSLLGIKSRTKEIRFDKGHAQKIEKILK